MSLDSSTLPQRILLTALLLVVAVAGAGLATAADRPHGDAHRPELTARADRLFAAWRERLHGELTGSEGQLTGLAHSGREVLGFVYQLQFADAQAAVVRGSDAALAVDAHRRALLDIRLAQARELADTRLGTANREFLRDVDAAIEQMAAAPDGWTSLAATAATVSELISALREHDELVAEAASAGRNGQWSLALQRLEPAVGALARARAVRERVATGADVSTLDDLLVRLAAYDEALGRLYGALDDGASPTSARVTALTEDVERAEEALPTDDSPLRVIVAEVGGPTAAQPLVVIERARGAVAAALGGDEE